MNTFVDNTFVVNAFHTALIGIGATAVMDIWLIALQKLHVPTLNFALLGRWVGHLFRAKWFHDGIAKSAPIRNELTIGWVTHYAIGVFFALLLVSMVGASWIENPTFIPAISIGIATVIAPFFIMQPAMGSGIASSKTATPIRNCVKSVINHSVFGCGLFLAADFLTLWI